MQLAIACLGDGHLIGVGSRFVGVKISGNSRQLKVSSATGHAFSSENILSNTEEARTVVIFFISQQFDT